MKPAIEDITDSVREWSIADAPQKHGQEPLRAEGSHVASHYETVQTLLQYTDTITSRMESVKSLVHDPNISSNHSIAEIGLLLGGTKGLTGINSKLKTTIDVLNEATEQLVAVHLRSLGGQSTANVSQRSPVQELLSHFDGRIKEIVREFLGNTGNQDLVLRVAEECYNQAINPFGTLRPDHCFNLREEASLAWPYDPDYESEGYYEHENRLLVDENYAVAFHERSERRSEARVKSRQSRIDLWVHFWIKVLNNIPAGPTLSYPPANLDIETLYFGACPPSLFRTFDKHSSGRNDESVIASVMSMHGVLQNSRIDILSLEKQRATQLLYLHLNKRCSSGRRFDNLMSWRSSFLFATQYAIWRSHYSRRYSSDVKICAVDTRKFPVGQFMRDVSLLKAYHATAEELGGETQSYFNFRLNCKDYYNGEYLSQGSVRISDRSCVVSLKQLIQAGLYELYPEFEEFRGRHNWTKRVRDLRQKWSVEQGTTDREIQLALALGRCFTPSEPLDMALTFLAFKNRRYSKSTLARMPDHFGRQRPEWADKPDEVYRYWSATEAVKSYNKVTYARIGQFLPQHHETLREIFADA